MGQEDHYDRTAIERDLKAIEPNLAAASRVLEPSVDLEERLRLLHNDAARAWWEANLQELRENAFLVRMPFALSRKRDELLATPRAIAVDSAWTHALREPL